ncbi:MAG TPA: glycosyltransferase family 1 protein [Candidatus Saccharimonadales bacterium]|nr:glycosyltransferase family 1 protein [Candidatus Saccharimonadales bacterium]
MKNDKKLEIVFDASPLLVNRTGVAYYTERLTQALAKTYPDQVHLTGFFYNFLKRRSNSHFPRLPNLHYRGNYVLPGKIVYQLRRWGIEVPIELFSPKRADFILYTNFLGYPTLRGTPSACVVHDLTFVDLPEYVSAKNGSDLRRFVPQQIKRSAFVITVSEFSKQKIAKTYGLALNRIVVTPIPPEKPRVISESQRKTALGSIGVAKPFILFLSTIEPRKNVIALIEAYKQLPDALRKRFTLVVAGRIGWNCDAEIVALKQAVADGYDVRHVGFVDETTRAVLFQTAAIFTTPSHYEGFGMPVLEAMSYGRPCAVSNIPVFKEIGGDAVAYFDQTNPKDIAQTLQTLLTDPKKLASLSTASKKHADTYNWTTVAQTVHDAITAHLRS